MNKLPLGRCQPFLKSMSSNLRSQKNKTDNLDFLKLLSWQQERDTYNLHYKTGGKTNLERIS